jgi:hypothetical protein
MNSNTDFLIMLYIYFLTSICAVGVFVAADMVMYAFFEFSLSGWLERRLFKL